MSYRDVSSMKADELLAVLTPEPTFQVELFRRMGGDPNSHKYAYLSFLTKQLRDRGYDVHSSRGKGVWLTEEGRENGREMDISGFPFGAQR